MVTVDTDITIGTLTLQNPASTKQYNINGTNKLTFDVASGNARINSVVNGTAHTINAPIEIADTLDVNITAASLRLNGPVTGTLSNPNVTINLIDDSTLRLSGNNNLGTGTININNGTLQLFTASTGLNTAGGGPGTTVKINGGTLLLSGDGAGAGANQYQVNVESVGANVTLNSSRSDTNTGAINEINSLIVRSGSTLNANNANGLGFALAIANGHILTLEDNSTLNWTRTPTFSFNADLLIQNGATLEGNGTINTNNGHQGDELRIQSGGKVAPGLSVGTLHIGTGSGMNTRTIFQAGSILEMEIFGATAGVTYDQIEIQGDLTITGSTLNLIDSGSGFQPEGDVYLWLVNNTSIGTLTGQFAGLGNGEIATTIGDRNFLIYYNANFATGELFGGNDIMLFSAGVPEPGTMGMLLLGLGLLAKRRKGQRLSKE